MTQLELQDSILRHALELQRLSAHEEREALAIMAELERDLRVMLATTDLSDARRGEINALIREAQEAIKGHYGTIAANTDTHGIAMMVAEKTTDILQEAFPAAAMPTAARLASVATDILIDGAPSSAWWAKQSGDLQFNFAREVRAGILLEETQEQIVTRIVGRRGEPGIMDTARRHVRTLVHSSVMTAANRTRLESYRKNSRHIAGVEWLATLDSHTCARCMAYDGAKWDLDGEPIRGTKLGFQAPQLHFGCRCVLSPIAKGLDDLLGVKGLDAKMAPSVRASSDGPTSATTMQEFLKRQSKPWLEESLGKGRAELFQEGKITVKDLVSGTGRELSLAELRAR